MDKDKLILTINTLSDAILELDNERDRLVELRDTFRKDRHEIIEREEVAIKIQNEKLIEEETKKFLKYLEKEREIVRFRKSEEDPDASWLTADYVDNIDFEGDDIIVDGKKIRIPHLFELLKEYYPTLRFA